MVKVSEPPAGTVRSVGWPSVAVHTTAYEALAYLTEFYELAVPVPDWTLFASDASTIPSACLSGAQILVILRRRNVAVAEIIVLIGRLRINQADAHQLFRMGEGKAAQDKGVYDRELRGHPGDAEREDEHGENTKSFFLEQNAETDADILMKSIEDHRGELG